MFCSVAARDISGRQLKIIGRSYSVPRSTVVDEVDVGDIGSNGNGNTIGIGDVIAGKDAASANAIAINQQVGKYIHTLQF